MVFCHEWLQVRDGQMCAMPLSDDLVRPASDPALLFTASQAPWVPLSEKGTYVTDGPFMYRTSGGRLLMLWSTFGPDGYAVTYAASESSGILGPWVQREGPLFDRHGGHGMIFRTFDGRLMLSIHQPNGPRPLERAIFLPIHDDGDGISLASI